MMRDLSRSFLLLCSALTIFYACRKTDAPMAASTPPEKVERFFTVPSGAPSEASVIAAAMEKQNRQFKFLSSLTKKAGYPVWDKIKVVHHDLTTINGKNTNESTSGETVFVPFVLDSQNKTNAVLAVRMNTTDTTYRMLYAKAYRRFGYDTTNGLKWNARDVFHLFTLFDRSIFGHTSFRILDESLFSLSTGGRPGILTMLPKAQGSATGKAALFAEIEECTNYQACDPVVRAAFGSDCTTITVCTTYYVDLGGGSGVSTSGTGDTGSTGGYDGSGDTGTGGTGGGSSDYWNDDGSEPCGLNGGRMAPTDCEDGWEPISRTSSYLPIIGADVSITNNPIINCVYSHLMDPSLQYGLKNILKAFDQSSVYNIKFQVGSIGSDGTTNYLQNNNWLTTINAANAEDPGYSRIWLASTFIHEAFHAKLRQHAIEVLGTDEVRNWPKAIDDMTLSELATYFEKSAQAKTLWNPLGHDWMVNNIDQLALSIREFVQKNYLTTYANVGSNLDAYRALAYMGLSGSQFYQEKVIAAGLDRQFAQYRSALSEGGQCNN